MPQLKEPQKGIYVKIVDIDEKKCPDSISTTMGVNNE
jgi:hypothetical protein